MKIFVIDFLAFLRQMVQQTDHQAANGIVILGFQFQSQAVV